MSFKYVATIISLIFVLIPAEMSIAAPSCIFNEAVSCSARTTREACESDDIAVDTASLNGVPKGALIVSYCVWESVKVDYQNTPVMLCLRDRATTSRNIYMGTCEKGGSTWQTCRQQSETIRKEMSDAFQSKTEFPSNICSMMPG